MTYLLIGLFLAHWAFNSWLVCKAQLVILDEVTLGDAILNALMGIVPTTGPILYAVMRLSNTRKGKPPIVIMRRNP